MAIIKEFEDELQAEYYWKGIRLCKEQLYCALEAFTSGETKKSVTAGDEANVFSTWSRLADKGNSRRDQHVMDMQRVAYAARGTVAAKDLEMAIVDWEKEVTQFEGASGKTMDPCQRIIIFIDMLPSLLRQRIKDFSEKFQTYEAIRAEVLIWLADNLPRNKGKLAMITDVVTETAPEIPNEQLDEFFEDPAKFGVPADSPLETFYAMVKSAHLKKTKGCGKGGKGGPKPLRKCYECDSEGHIAAECLQRAARVAAGGLERLDDPMGLGKAKGKGKKGKGDKGGGKG